jgi:hypothetical protein
VAHGEGKESFMRTGERGSADIIGLLPGGRFLAVECKSAKGRLSPVQAAWLGEVERSGGAVFVARSADELRTKMCEAGI